VIDELPPFAYVELTGEVRPPEGLNYPMWLKPIKGFSSELAFQVRNDQEFTEAADAIRAGISRVGEPFQYVLDQVDLPPDIAEIGGQACLAEEALTGNQVATEGYVYQGEINVYGVLDSINYPESSTFLRHQYPSQLPESVQRRLKDVSRRVIEQVGLDNSTFSIEFFHDPDTDAISLLEVNPRHSQSHAALFRHVDGVPNHQAMLKLALGQDPRFDQGQGRYRIAAKYYHRWFSDGIVRRVPTDDEIERIEAEIPGVSIYPVPREGQRLSELAAQDSYSFELTDIMIGADSVTELEDKYERIVKALPYDIEDTESKHTDQAEPR
jgi:biotin carboxylase